MELYVGMDVSLSGIGFHSLNRLGKAARSLCELPDQGRIHFRLTFGLPLPAIERGEARNLD